MMLPMLCIFFFFFNQKTAYEMRISDWSSDVCSSDLFDATENTLAAYAQAKYAVDLSSSISLDGVVGVRYIRTDRTIGTFVSENKGPFERLAAKRSEERRGGKECVSTCSSRWATDQ